MVVKTEIDLSRENLRTLVNCRHDSAIYISWWECSGPYASPAALVLNRSQAEELVDALQSHLGYAGRQESGRYTMGMDYRPDGTCVAVMRWNIDGTKTLIATLFDKGVKSS